MVIPAVAVAMLVSVVVVVIVLLLVTVVLEEAEVVVFSGLFFLQKGHIPIGRRVTAMTLVSWSSTLSTQGIEFVASCIDALFIYEFLHARHVPLRECAQNDVTAVNYVSLL